MLLLSLSLLNQNLPFTLEYLLFSTVGIFPSHGQRQVVYLYIFFQPAFTPSHEGHSKFSFYKHGIHKKIQSPCPQTPAITSFLGNPTIIPFALSSITSKWKNLIHNRVRVRFLSLHCQLEPVSPKVCFFSSYIHGTAWSLTCNEYSVNFELIDFFKMFSLKCQPP